MTHTKHLKLFLLLVFSSLSVAAFAQQVDMSIFHDMEPRNIGPAGMSGRVTSIAVDLNDTDNILLGSAAGGIFKSENAGHTWTPIFDNELAASIGDIAIYQKNPDIIYVGTGEGNPRNSQNSGWGMFKSIDGGKTWQHLGLEMTRQIHRVIVHPDNPDVVVIGASGATWGESAERGVYKTTDGGKTWKKVLYVNERTGVSDLVVDPSNPNKMLVGMWEHRRWPWFFKSGGPGTGLYMTNDGGDTWEKITNGLPAGELGRIGLSFAPSNPKYVYAYIESKDNGVYRSTDGGYTWQRMSKPGDSGIGGRPFYYADIYVDTKNENRVYSIASTVTVTEDGGRNWEMFAPGNKIHTDHHAWWSHPDDPEFIMIGHDGGLNITHDRGENWWFADNLPLAQFYHLRVDNEFPYNVYGGLQDNGSWKGPSRTWFKGGIRNMYWQRLSVGDGFDVVPDPKNHLYGYAMGQAGGLLRYHTTSGQLTQIKPVHPDGEYLRFNWNAGINIDPFDQQTIYYGSQYLHKSSDYGKTWEIISPDLTTDDPEKQDLKSGGLSYDVTGAEYHTTIIAIAPSPVEEGVIWVGTDDGNVQLTRDGGENWTNLIDNIKGVPANTWVPHILASRHKAGEAFVVFDDHRRNNWEPFVYHTDDFGKTWTRLVDESDVRGYVYTIEQDPEEPNLLFCGTEFGLYVSFDGGKNWNEWTNGFPTVPVSDLVVQPTEHDLVIATFGRAFWILDDIRPLREMAQRGTQAVMNKNLHLFPTPDAHLMIIGESIGYRDGKIGDALYNGENRPYGALISYYVENTNLQKPADADPFWNQAKVEILDGNKVVRTFYDKPQVGVNRVNWNLRADGVRFPMRPEPSRPSAPPQGFEVAPGTYQVRVSYGDASEIAYLVVKADPRLENISDRDIAAKMKLFEEYESLVSEVTSMMDELRAAQKSLNFLNEKLDAEDHSDLHKKVKDTQQTLKELMEQVTGEDVQGIWSDPNTVTSQMFAANRLLDHPLVPPSENQRTQLKHFANAVEDFASDFNNFRKSHLQPLQQDVKAKNISIFE